MDKLTQLSTPSRRLLPLSMDPTGGLSSHSKLTLDDGGGGCWIFGSPQDRVSRLGRSANCGYERREFDTYENSARKGAAKGILGGRQQFNSAMISGSAQGSSKAHDLFSLKPGPPVTHPAGSAFWKGGFGPCEN